MDEGKEELAAVQLAKRPWVWRVVEGEGNSFGRPAMKVAELVGDARRIGRLTGEHWREEIAQHMEMFPPIHNRAVWDRRLPAFMQALRRWLPQVLEEIEGTAEGSNQSLDDILALNLPMYGNENDVREGCTNIAFAGGRDGPVWGKNNDGYAPGHQRPACGRLVRRDDGIPSLVFTFCGMVATTDCMNAEGLAMGHSSVGSIYQQSDHHVPIRLWAYECLLKSRTTGEFVRQLTSLTTRGKGYSILCVDSRGTMCSVEAPCPVMQVRHPQAGKQFMNCVNYYQLPQLWEADRRPEEGKLNAISRRHFLDAVLEREVAPDLMTMKRLLRHHGDVSICRHGDSDGSHTEYSMIGLPMSRKVLYLAGYPCEEQYSELSL